MGPFAFRGKLPLLLISGFGVGSSETMHIEKFSFAWIEEKFLVKNVIVEAFSEFFPDDFKLSAIACR